MKFIKFLAMQYSLRCDAREFIRKYDLRIVLRSAVQCNNKENTILLLRAEDDNEKYCESWGNWSVELWSQAMFSEERELSPHNFLFSF